MLTLQLAYRWFSSAWLERLLTLDYARPCCKMVAAPVSTSIILFLFIIIYSGNDWFNLNSFTNENVSVSHDCHRCSDLIIAMLNVYVFQYHTTPNNCVQKIRS